MNTQADNRTIKQQQILDAAIELIGAHGDAGLTMRKLADRADMSLSNVQYYFKSKDIVLAAMVDRYCAACEEAFLALANECADWPLVERMERLIGDLLKHGDEVSDMCRVFRELWAIATRNAVVQQALERYYRQLCALISQSMLGSDATTDDQHMLATLVLPYIEGYSITAPSLPMARTETTRMLTGLLLQRFDGERPSRER
ncbi:MAG: TetR/AcrR family transcriptional regulator [Pseudomonadota bacterium]